MKSVLRSAKNFTKGYSDVQIQVREATSNDEWGPTIQQLDYIARCTFNPSQFSDIIYIIDKRLNDHGKYWRHVYKTLLVIEYGIVCGAESMVVFAKERLHEIRTLREFRAVDEHGNDNGIAVREKSKDIVALLTDEEKLFRARETKTLPSQRRPSSTGPLTIESQSHGSQSNSRTFSSSTINANSTGNRRSFDDLQTVDEDAALAMAIAASKAESDSLAKSNEDLMRCEAETTFTRSNTDPIQKKPEALSADQLLDLDDDAFERALETSYKPCRKASTDIFGSHLMVANVVPQQNSTNFYVPQVAPPLYYQAPAVDPFAELGPSGLSASYSGPIAPLSPPAPQNDDALASPSMPSTDPFADSFANPPPSRNPPPAAKPQPATRSIHPIAIPHPPMPELSVGAKPVMPGSIAPQFGNQTKYDATKDVAHHGMFIKVMPSAEANESKTTTTTKDPFADLL